MEPSNTSSSQDANNRPRADRGQGTEERGGTRDTYSGRGNRRRGNQFNKRQNENSMQRWDKGDQLGG